MVEKLEIVFILTVTGWVKCMDWASSSFISPALHGLSLPLLTLLQPNVCFKFLNLLGWKERGSPLFFRFHPPCLQVMRRLLDCRLCHGRMVVIITILYSQQWPRGDPVPWPQDLIHHITEWCHVWHPLQVGGALYWPWATGMRSLCWCWEPCLQILSLWTQHQTIPLSALATSLCRAPMAPGGLLISPLPLSETLFHLMYPSDSPHLTPSLGSDY